MITIEHPESAQAAEFAAELTAQQVRWARLEWWPSLYGQSLYNITPDSGRTPGVQQMTEVGGIFN